MNNNKLLASILFGFSAGLVLGVLLAPGDGTETRKIIRKRSAAFVDSLNNMLMSIVSPDVENEEDVAENSNRLKIGPAESEFNL
jgi:gas vesicle protein